jgi:hypothetical protein
MTQTTQVVAGGVVELNSDHVTLYASKAGCLGSPCRQPLDRVKGEWASFTLLLAAPFRG